MLTRSVMREFLNYGKVISKSQVCTKWFKILRNNTIYKTHTRANLTRCLNQFRVLITWVIKWCWQSLIRQHQVELLNTPLTRSIKLVILSSKVIKCSQIVMELICTKIPLLKMICQLNLTIRDGHLVQKTIIMSNFNKFIMSKCHKHFRLTSPKESLLLQVIMIWFQNRRKMLNFSH